MYFFQLNQLEVQISKKEKQKLILSTALTVQLSFIEPQWTYSHKALMNSTNF